MISDRFVFLTQFRMEIKFPLILTITVLNSFYTKLVLTKKVKDLLKIRLRS